MLCPNNPLNFHAMIALVSLVGIEKVLKIGWNTK